MKKNKINKIMTAAVAVVLLVCAVVLGVVAYAYYEMTPPALASAAADDKQVSFVCYPDSYPPISSADLRADGAGNVYIAAGSVALMETSSVPTLYSGLYSSADEAISSRNVVDVSIFDASADIEGYIWLLNVNTLDDGDYSLIFEHRMDPASLFSFSVSSAAAPSLQLSKSADNVDGVEYNVYKLFTADVNDDGLASNIQYAASFNPEKYAAACFPSGYDFTYPQRTAEYIADNIKSGALAASDFGMSLASALAANMPATTSITSGGSAVEVDGTGYYLVVRKDALTGNVAASSPIFALVGAGTTEITEKSALPSITKYVKEDSTGEWAKEADQTIGSTLEYKIVGTLPSNLAAYDKYVYKLRTPIRSILSSPKVMIDGVEVPYSAYRFEGKLNEFSIIFDDLLACGVEVSPSSEIVVEYAETFDGGRRSTPAYLEYSNNPVNVASRGSASDVVEIYSYEFFVNVSDKATGEALPDVGFTVKNSSGVYLTNVSDDPDRIQIAESIDPYMFHTDAAGSLEFCSVDADVYTVEEVAPLADYNALPAPFTLSINASDRSTVVYGLTDGSGLVSADEGKIAVQNEKLLSLPLTGMAGYAGAVLVGAALVGFVLYRRSRPVE